MIVSVSHQKGGVGKSTLVFNLLYYYVYIKKINVMAVDLDAQQSITLLNEVRKISDHPTLPIVHTRDENELASMVSEYAEQPKKLLLTDSGGFDSALNRIVVYATDYLVCPLRDKPLEVLGLQKFHQLIELVSKEGEKHIVANILLNNIHHFAKNFDGIESIVDRSPHLKLMPNIVYTREVFSKLMEEGKTVFEEDDSRAKDGQNDISQLAETILKEISWQ